jgi:hypothetical protein
MLGCPRGRPGDPTPEAQLEIRHDGAILSVR